LSNVTVARPFPYGMAAKGNSEEVCPNCGRWITGRLEEETGWCSDCSQGVITTQLAATNLFNKVEQYLTANADEIEHYLIQGHSLNASIDLLHHTNGRPKCLVCGSQIYRAKRSAIFCRSTKECRRYSRRYVYLYREKGLSKAEALATVLNELT